MIAVLTAVLRGLGRVRASSKGIKYLSNANAIAAGLLVFFLFVVGPTVFILGTFTESMGDYLTQLPGDELRAPASSAGSEWLNGWTIFYWAWWISLDARSSACSSRASPRAARSASS